MNRLTQAPVIISIFQAEKLRAREAKTTHLCVRGQFEAVACVCLDLVTPGLITCFALDEPEILRPESVPHSRKFSPASALGLLGPQTFAGNSTDEGVAGLQAQSAGSLHRRILDDHVKVTGGVCEQVPQTGQVPGGTEAWVSLYPLGCLLRTQMWLDNHRAEVHWRGPGPWLPVELVTLQVPSQLEVPVLITAVTYQISRVYSSSPGCRQTAKTSQVHRPKALL